jgi:hypothetical protein
MMRRKQTAEVVFSSIVAFARMAPPRGVCTLQFGGNAAHREYPSTL